MAVNSIDYDVDLDFLLNFPKVPVKSVNNSKPEAEVLVHQNDRPHNVPPAPSSYEVDCLITPDRHGTKAATDRPTVAKVVPSVDRSTKPSALSSVSGTALNNFVSDTATNSQQGIVQTSSKSTSDKNDQLPKNADAPKNIVGPKNVSNRDSVNKMDAPAVDPPSSVSGSHLSNRSRSVTTVSLPPVAPDRSTKPVLPATSSLSDANVLGAKLEKEQAELSLLQARKVEEAAALANLMREKRKLETEMKKTKQQIDGEAAAKYVFECQ